MENKTVVFINETKDCYQGEKMLPLLIRVNSVIERKIIAFNERKHQKYIVIKERKGQILNEICTFYEKKSIVITERSVLFLMRDKKEKLTRKVCGCQREKSLVLHEKNCLYEVKVVVINKRKVVINERKIVVIKKRRLQHAKCMLCAI